MEGGRGLSRSGGRLSAEPGNHALGLKGVLRPSLRARRRQSADRRGAQHRRLKPPPQRRASRGRGPGRSPVRKAVKVWEAEGHGAPLARSHVAALADRPRPHRPRRPRRPPRPPERGSEEGVRKGFSPVCRFCRFSSILSPLRSAPRRRARRSRRGPRAARAPQDPYYTRDHRSGNYVENPNPHRGSGGCLSL